MSDLGENSAADEAMSMADYYRNVRLLIEQDLEAGIQFAPLLGEDVPAMGQRAATAKTRRGGNGKMLCQVLRRPFPPCRRSRFPICRMPLHV